MSGRMTVRYKRRLIRATVGVPENGKENENRRKEEAAAKLPPAHCITEVK